MKLLLLTKPFFDEDDVTLLKGHKKSHKNSGRI